LTKRLGGNVAYFVTNQPCCQLCCRLLTCSPTSKAKPTLRRMIIIINADEGETDASARSLFVPHHCDTHYGIGVCHKAPALEVEHTVMPARRHVEHLGFGRTVVSETEPLTLRQRIWHKAGAQEYKATMREAPAAAAAAPPRAPARTRRSSRSRRASPGKPGRVGWIQLGRLLERGRCGFPSAC
jgi:hypothetical protein